MFILQKRKRKNYKNLEKQENILAEFYNNKISFFRIFKQQKPLARFSKKQNSYRIIFKHEKVFSSLSEKVLLAEI